MKKNLKKLFYALILLGMLSPVMAQDVQVSENLNAPMPVDKNVSIGTLKNGVKYYIRHNETPKDRAQLRLVLNAGSVLEDDDQQGLAHFLEHMCFNGTENFKKHEIVDFMERIGMKFGAEVNAYTSFDETVYMLSIPTDNKDIMDSAFMILSEWAHNVSLEEEEIDKERGVIEEEWRLGQGAGDRMQRKYFPVLMNGSRYASRIPIGTMEVVKNFDYDVLKRFYKTWYRTDLMAVVAVGDFDVARVENMIMKHFALIPKTKNPKERTVYEIPPHDKTLVTVVSDKENPQSAIQMFIKHKAPKEVNHGTYRENIVDGLISSMLMARFQEKTQEANQPFMFAYGAYSGFLRGNEAFMLYAVSKINRVEESFEVMLREVERAKRYGFLNTELERQKIEMLSSMEKSYNERNTTNSTNYTGEYQRNFLQNESIPGIEYEYAMYKKYMPTITLDEINKRYKSYLTDENRVIIALLPEKKDVKTVKEKSLLKILKKVSKAKDIEPYVDKVSNEPLIKELPEAGKITSEKKIAEIDAVEWTLSNGVKVVAKKTDFKQDEILMRAYSYGGTSLYGMNDYYSARYADNIIDRSGIGNFDLITLQKMLAGKKANVSPFISEIHEGFNGSCVPKDLETMMQLNYLYFTAPRKDLKAYANFIAEQREQIRQNGTSPQSVFRDSLRAVMSNYHPRRTAMTEADLAKVDLNRAMEIYKERFADASDFVFFFVGNFDEATLKQMVEKYLGSLPGSGKHEAFKDLGIRPPKKSLDKEVFKGVDPKSTIYISFPGVFKYDEDEMLKIQAMVDVLNIRLRENIREEQSGVYSISAWASESKYPYENYSLNVYFGCAPENVDKLVASVYEEIKALQNEGTNDINLNKVKETLLRTRESKVQENRFWLSTLQRSYFNNTSLTDFNAYNDKVKAIDNDDIKAMAEKYFNLDHVIKVVLQPEEKK